MNDRQPLLRGQSRSLSVIMKIPKVIEKSNNPMHQLDNIRLKKSPLELISGEKVLGQKNKIKNHRATFY